MKKTQTALSSSDNPSLLEMRILANHGSDPRFSFLRKGKAQKWKSEWEKIKRGEEVVIEKAEEEKEMDQDEEKKKQLDEKEGKGKGKATDQDEKETKSKSGLVMYGSDSESESDDEDQEEEQTEKNQEVLHPPTSPPPPPPPPLPPSDPPSTSSVVDVGVDEAKKLKLARAREWAEKKRAEKLESS